MIQTPQYLALNSTAARSVTCPVVLGVWAVRAVQPALAVSVALGRLLVPVVPQALVLLLAQVAQPEWQASVGWLDPAARRPDAVMATWMPVKPAMTGTM
jgi:hypothetical protein